jgi:DNA repair exonuclease SbcCD ATPase subunit
MGLFSKKPKSIIVQQPPKQAAPDAEPLARLEELTPMVEGLPQLSNPPKLDPPPQAARPANPPKPARAPKPPKQNKKVSVDPTDFLALRSELIDMKARLDESEQARALVEARLTSLDAAASAFATERNDITEVANMVIQLQQQVNERANAEGTGGSGSPTEGGHDELSAKVDALQNRLFGLQDPAPKIAEFEDQLAQLRSELETATAAAAEAAAMPPPPPTASGPDPEMLERIAAVQQRVNDLDQIRHRLGEIDHLKERVGEIDLLNQRVSGVEAMNERFGELDNVDQRLASVDGLAMQLQQLNARVAAQAELGGQLSALRDRVTQLAEQPHGGGADDDVRLQLQEIGERLRSNEELQAQVSQLLERSGASDTEARAVREHMALLDQRLTNVSTELANQLSELGRDIDGLGQRIPEVAEGTVSDEVVDALRGGQVKLANEQARYEIAFREDLAALAEQLRRGRPDH